VSQRPGNFTKLRLTAKENTMKRFILTTMAVAFAAMFASTTNLEAAPHKVVSHAAVHAHVAPHAPLVVHHGPSGHVPFHVHGYRGWVSRCWFPGYGCYGYYCGTEQVWYYWYAPFNEYLPISYMSIYPPTAGGVAPVNMVQAAPGMPALPSGASFVPGPITNAP
jgi:hypothetical protein